MADALVGAVNAIEDLAREYPLLYLNPDVDSQDAYRRVVPSGEAPGKSDLSHHAGEAIDRHPCSDPLELIPILIR